LGVPVRDLTDKAYIGLLSDKEIFERIAYGNKKVPYIVMPGWLDQISANTINDIIAYVRSLEVDNGPLVGLGPQERTELYKISPLERGRINYLLYCSSCHGFKGDGDGWASKNFKKMPTVFSDPEFIGNFTAERIFNYVKGLDKTYKDRTMPIFGQTIESAVIEDITSYILSLSEASMSEPSIGSK
jgi:mono/diheme cytochrome c family protein